MELPELWEHQKNAIKKAEPPATELALFMEPGTGKTRTVLEIIRGLFNRNQRIMRTLIIAPLIVTKNWVEEIQKFTKIPPEKIFLLKGSIAEKAAAFTKIVSGVVIVNYDAFVKDEFAKAAIAWQPEILILDEAHRCKEPTAKRTKNITKLSLSMITGYRYLLTGTPVTNNQLDLWSQFYILDHGKTFGNSFYGFKGFYFYNANAGRVTKDGQKMFPLWLPRPGIDTMLHDKIKNKAMIVKKEECMDLPPMVYQEIEVELSPEQSRLYKEMKKDFITFIKNKEAVASLALTKMMRMQQILSGFLKMEDGTIERFDNPRARVLGELLSDFCGTSKVIVWSIFHEDYVTVRKACELAGVEYVEVNGLVGPKEKFAAIERFQKEEKVRVFSGSPKAGGIGINLVEAPIAIWFDRSHSLEESEQAEARNYRGGSERHLKVTRIDLVARNTIDEIILKAVRDKKKIADTILSIDTTTF